jgi:hypothetical protein
VHAWLWQSGCYHAFIRICIRISVKEFRWNKSCRMTAGLRDDETTDHGLRRKALTTDYRTTRRLTTGEGKRGHELHELTRKHFCHKEHREHKKIFNHGWHGLHGLQNVETTGYKSTGRRDDGTTGRRDEEATDDGDSRHGRCRSDGAWKSFPVVWLQRCRAYGAGGGMANLSLILHPN